MKGLDVYRTEFKTQAVPVARGEVPWIVPFAYAGGLEVSSSPYYYPGGVGARVVQIIASVKTTGGTPTDIRVNGSYDVYEFSIPADTIYVSLDLTGISFGSNAYGPAFYVEVITPGIAAADLDVQLFLVPGFYAEGGGGGEE